MHIFTLEIEDNNFDNAEFVSAPERSIELEQHLESWLENNPWILVQGDSILWIGRQTSAPVEDTTIFPDLLGVDTRGNLVIVELKRNRTPRDTVAQLLDYATWANELSESRIHEIAEHYFDNQNGFSGKTFSDAFREVLLINETDEVPPLNRGLRLFILAGRISDRILKVCRFLRSSCRMDVSCVEVSLFQTESGDAIVSMETKLGGENRVDPNLQQADRESEDTLRWQTTWQAILEVTHGDPNGSFTTREVRESVLREHPRFNKNTISGNISSFRGVRHIVSETIQELINANIEITIENIMKAALEENPDFSQARIRKMIDLFSDSKSIQIQPNQGEEISES